MIRIRRGLDLRIPGAPGERVEASPPVRHVALLGDDYVGLRPRLAVRPGDRVRLGQLLFEDKGNAAARFVSPGAGEVVAVHRGEKRRLLSVVVRLDGEEEETFPGEDLGRAAIVDRLVASGLWTALRARPFGRIPAPDGAPSSLFVTAIDTNPLAPDPARALEGREPDFERGLGILARLVDGPVRLCRQPGAPIPAPQGVEVHEFAGPHPAGLVGTHIHFLDPVGEGRTAWHVGCEDVAAIGGLFRTGRLPVERVVALGGPMVERPAVVRTRLGASVDELLEGRVRPGPSRAVSGSVLSGRTAAGPVAFLGRYHRQVSVLSDGRPRSFLAWLRPRLAASFTTAAHGQPRAIVPIGAYERVLPLDLLPTPLFKALAVGDLERAVELGCLELEEEDLALCAYVCPSKSDLGGWLRATLARIEGER